ncbi:MAG: anhydro-N-acetylmuramic acid kinase [Deltaproteobacteria bacterium]
MQLLSSIIAKRRRLVVGLMSGTSMDGIDAALVEIQYSGVETRLHLIDFLCIPYGANLLARLRGIRTVEDVSELNFLVGEAFASAALLLIREAGFSPRDVDLVGSHGQTVFHNPPSHKKGAPSTLQLGEPDVIAERTGIATVGDFRTRDVAAGGEGAPLVPYADFIMFREFGRVRIAQNIGGIANLTLVADDIDEVIAFDTGPGNMPMDRVIVLATGGNRNYDRGAQVALGGRVDEGLFRDLLSHPYFETPPPKSTGAEVFGDEFASKLYALAQSGKISLADLMRTLAELTVETIARAYERFIFPKWKVSEVILSGGGTYNPLLVGRLAERLGEGVRLSKSDKFGVPSDAKEAIAFAVLANELISGNCANLPKVTGAARRVPLGKIALA